MWFHPAQFERALPSRRPWLRLSLAAVFSAATVLYAGIWMYCVRWEQRAQLGLSAWSYDYEAASKRGYIRVQQVAEGGGAAQAGLRAGDLILAINGQPLDTLNPFSDEVWNGRPGDTVALSVERPGETRPLELRVVLEPVPRGAGEKSWAQAFAEQLLVNYPLLFLAVGLPVLFLRVEDRNAWLLALLFAGMIALAPLVWLGLEPRIPRALRGYAVGYKILFNGLSAALFCYFFAVFPVASPVDRRLPWVKTALLGVAAAVCVPLAVWAFAAGSFLPLMRFGNGLPSWAGYAITTYFFGGFLLGLVSLVGNAFAAPAGEARRKTRVMIWGTVVGMTPAILLYAAAISRRQDPYQYPFWVWAPCIITMFLIPLSFGYAVLKHRVMEIPVLLRRSARHVLVQRGAVTFGALAGTGITLVSARMFSRLFPAQPEASVAVGIAFGALLLSIGVAGGKRLKERIDRAFFRKAYDARKILEDLATKARTARSHRELGALIRSQLQEALEPAALVVYLETADGRLDAEQGTVPAGMETIPATNPLLAELARRGQPWDAPPELSRAYGLGVLGASQPECLVPMLGRDARLMGVFILGPRLSEEPYSREDKRLFASVASQAGIALESILLAAKMAEQMETERRSAHEMEMAREVQARLFPQKLPALASLDYAGRCIQARKVGGDYYDFLHLGPGRLALVLADIAGKGFSGALLMANLQANLRSQYAAALDNLPRLLESVNHLFYENTAEDAYATLFFADYDDQTRRLRYANCGHLPPLLLRADGTCERLEATATVLGLFEKWECGAAERVLAPGDLLVLYSDGITEARNARDQEFGEARLHECLRAHAHLSPAELLDATVAAVREFSGTEQEDDITMVLARGR